MKNNYIKAVKKDILLTFLFLLPVLFLYSCHYSAVLFSSGTTPTGFLQLDQPFYMAAAREYQDQNLVSLTYANPSDPDVNAPKVYFQFPVWILALLLNITGWNPGLLFMLFGLISAWFCIFLSIRFWRNICSDLNYLFYPGILLLLWGGGLLSLGGMVWSVIQGHPAQDIFHFDPSHGWWFLNWGRNLVLPLEAFYHLLFVGMIYALYRYRLNIALLLLTLLILSHPFTGLIAALIIVPWSLFEKIIRNNNQIAWYFPVTATLLLCLHLFYYMLYLPSIPSHQQVLDQWKLNWELSPVSALLAWLPLAVPAILSWYTRKNPGFNQSFRTLIIIWILTVLLLSFNNLFLKGYQPLHFTRGYLYLALFLAAYPVFDNLLRAVIPLKRSYRTFLLIAFIIVMLSDNLTWFYSAGKQELQGKGLHLSASQQHMIDYLSKTGKINNLLISDDFRLGYYSIVYTPVRSLYSHWANTPAALEKVSLGNTFRMKGIIQEQWKNQTLIFIRDKRKNLTPDFLTLLSSQFTVKDSCDQYLLYCQKK